MTALLLLGLLLRRSPADPMYIMGQEVIDERDEECTVNSGFGAKGVHFRKILKVTKAFMGRDSMKVCT
jgi:hypothetical protein